jgi:hypothetical protein
MSDEINVLTGQPVGPEALKFITDLASKALVLMAEIETLEAKTLEKQKLLQGLIEEKIPTAMSSVGMSEFKTTMGVTVQVRPFYAAKIPDNRKSEAFKWLTDRKHDSIIKSEVSVSFGKGEREKADGVVAVLMKQGYLPVKTEGIHHQTLKAFVKEQVEAGEPLPLDLFGVYIGKRAKFELPTTK